VSAVGDRLDTGAAEALLALREKLAAEPQRPVPVPPVVFVAPPEQDWVDEEAQQ
jgi:hypothetical protein